MIINKQLGKVKSFLSKFFNFKKAKEIPDPDKVSRKMFLKTESCNVHLSIFENENLNFKINNNKGYITNNLLLLSALPAFYLLSSILIIITLLYLKFQNKIEFSSDIKLKNVKIPNFFDLQKVCPPIFNLYIGLNSLSGLAIVFMLFSVLKQRFKVPEYQMHSFKLNIMFIFGFVSNLINVMRAVAPPVLENYYKIVSEIQPNIEIDFNVLIFLSFIFFSVLFSLYSLSILSLLKDKNTMFRNYLDCQSQKNHWYLYKFITLTYICSFTLIYILFLLNNAEIFQFGFITSLIKSNYIPVISMFPYFIHIINAMLVFTFYFELKFINLALSQNLEVDYLFEEDKLLS